MKKIIAAIVCSLGLVLGTGVTTASAGYYDNWWQTKHCDMGPYSIYPFKGTAKVYLRVYSDGRDNILWTRPHAAPMEWQPGGPGQREWHFATLTFDGKYARHYNDPWYAWHDRDYHLIRFWFTNGIDHKHCTIRVGFYK